MSSTASTYCSQQSLLTTASDNEKDCHHGRQDRLEQIAHQPRPPGGLTGKAVDGEDGTAHGSGTDQAFRSLRHLQLRDAAQAQPTLPYRQLPIS
jgi:hypothetical protein